jgi:hypothetical protein
LCEAANINGERSYRNASFDGGELTQRVKSDISHCGILPAISGQSADARRGVPYRGEHRQAAERAAADIEGHSTAAKFG